MNEPSAEEHESRRLAQLLSRLLKLDGRSVRSVEQQLGLGGSSLGKVLNGNIRLQVDHILTITRVLGMTPGQFFQLAYPKKEPTHRLVAELRKTQGLPAKGEEPDPASPELEAAVRQIVLRMVGELLRQQGAEPAAEGPDAKS